MQKLAFTKSLLITPSLCPTLGGCHSNTMVSIQTGAWVLLGYVLCQLQMFVDWKSIFQLDEAASRNAVTLAFAVPTLFYLLAILLPMAMLAWKECS